MDYSKLTSLFHTVRYLKLKQIFFRLYYVFRRFFFKLKLEQVDYNSTYQLKFIQCIPSQKSYSDGKFSFLNISHRFDKIDWNLSSYGKLWTYNLNYFDFLNQEDISKEEGLFLILDFINKEKNLKDGLEPYPISLRVINWLKFISIHQIKNDNIDDSLYMQISLLSKSLEYHLLGNHLLENAFSMLFGAYYFRDENFYLISNKLLEGELREQILDDGAHFELSPMYHTILLTRLLDCVNLTRNNSWKKDQLFQTLNENAQKMLGWLNEIKYKNDELPQVNDSTYGVSVSMKDLFSYCDALKLIPLRTKLSDSGYRKWAYDKIELLIDVGQIGPDYIPGHAHADTFNFELQYNGAPIIVDTGISTYEKNALRQLERSTESHNTIRVNGINSSDVWGGFRVGRRAKIVYLKESENSIEATHNGYNRIKLRHTRSFSKNNNSINIYDNIESRKDCKVESFLHFHPDCSVLLNDQYVTVGSEITIKLFYYKEITLTDYNYPIGFNRFRKAKKISAVVEKKSKIEIHYDLSDNIINNK